MTTARSAHPPTTRRTPRELAIAATVAGALSGAPSTLHALLTGRPPLAGARAAGQLLGRPGLVRGALAHVALSIWWTVVLEQVLPQRHRAWWGAAAGVGIGVVDLAVARRRYPAIADLPIAGQLTDHALFGALAAGLFPPLTDRRRT